MGLMKNKKNISQCSVYRFSSGNMKASKGRNIVQKSIQFEGNNLNAPRMCNGAFVICMRDGYIVHEDPISSGYFVGNVYLPSLSYERIKEVIIHDLGGKLSKRNLKFATDLANYIDVNR